MPDTLLDHMMLGFMAICLGAIWDELRRIRAALERKQ